MEKIKITREMLAEAEDYLPCTAKEAWVEENAAKCFDRLAVKVDEDPLPPMYMVNEGIKRRYLMAAFAKLYMKQEYDADERDPALMGAEDYDKWAGGHVFSQMERLKRDAEARDKCFDLLDDFRDLEKRFFAHIAGLLAVQNDAVVRQAQYSTASLQALPGLLEQLKALQDGKGEADGAADSSL